MNAKFIDIKDAIAILKEIITESAKSHASISRTIVFCGGTAMSAHNIRQYSEDIDFYASEFPDDIVYMVEQKYKRIYGEAFKIDATSTENIWGALMLRDIQEKAVEVERIQVEGEAYSIKSLTIEDLVLLKTGADRHKDRQDIEMLALYTSPDPLVARFNETWKWYGNRDGLLRYADNFINTLESHYEINGLDIIETMTLPEHIKEMLIESRADDDYDCCPGH